MDHKQYLIEYGNSKKIITVNPESGNLFHKQVAESLNITTKFIIQKYNSEWEDYIDIDANEIPENKAKLKVIEDNTSNSDNVGATTSGVRKQVVQDILDNSPTKGLRKKPWPGESVELPKFKPEVTVWLSKEDAKAVKGERSTFPPKNILQHILERIGEYIHTYTLRPNLDQRIQVAKLLVQQHPGLKIPGTKEGWEGWEKRFYNYMSHLRQKLRDDEPELAGTGGRRSKANPAGKPSKSGFSKAHKRGAINDTPSFPSNYQEDDFEKMRLDLVTKYELQEEGTAETRKLMSLTFAQRRKEIKERPLIKNFINDRWPMLQHTSHIIADFNRITSIDSGNLVETLDANIDHLLSIMALRTGKRREDIQQLLAILEHQSEKEDTTVEVVTEHKRETVLKCIPHYMSENADGFYQDKEGVVQMNMSTKELELDMAGMGVVVLHIKDGTETVDYAIVAERVLIADGIESFIKAVQAAFAAHYVLDMEYSKISTNTWNFIQKVLVEIDVNKIPTKVQALRVKMLQKE